VFANEKIRKSYSVYPKLENVNDVETYDSPEQSVKKDFKAIEDSDVFILLHPKKMQASSFIELGYAYALDKKILIVSEKENLPYIALGLCTGERKVIILPPQNMDIEVIRILNTWE
jgi:nucleoside 2-deoxyribosyltransferase